MGVVFFILIFLVGKKGREDSMQVVGGGGDFYSGRFFLLSVIISCAFFGSASELSSFPLLVKSCQPAYGVILYFVSFSLCSVSGWLLLSLSKSTWRRVVGFVLLQTSIA